MKRQLLSLALISFLIFSNSALADDQTTPNPEPKKLESAKELVALMAPGINSTVPNGVQQVVISLIERDNPKQNEKVEKLVNDAFNQSMSAHSNKTDTSVAFYTNRFTNDELQEAITFYKSPTGQKFARLMPKAIQLAADTQTQVSIESRKESVQSVIASLKKNDLKVPKELTMGQSAP